MALRKKWQSALPIAGRGEARPPTSIPWSGRDNVLQGRCLEQVDCIGVSGTGGLVRSSSGSVWVWLSLFVSIASAAAGQTISGEVHDETGGVLPGVTVEAHAGGSSAKFVVTDGTGTYRLELGPGQYDLN